jgi:hypothetical protein
VDQWCPAFGDGREDARLVRDQLLQERRVQLMSRRTRRLAQGLVQEPVEQIAQWPLVRDGSCDGLVVSPMLEGIETLPEQVEHGVLRHRQRTAV